MKIFLLVLTKLTLLRKTKTVGSQNKKENKVEMFELRKSCRLDINLVDLILQMLSVLSKNTENYFPSLYAACLDWVRDPFVLSSFESSELFVAEEDELMKIGNDRRLKLEHSSTDMASFW
jgi:hypothetical protein